MNHGGRQRKFSSLLSGLFSHRLATVGAVITVLIVLLALVGPKIANQDPLH